MAIHSRRPRSLVGNIGANWVGFFVFALSGFVLPRLIGDHLGRQMLGIWDFAWSLVAYTGLLALGITSAVGRFVAQHRAVGDWRGLSRTISTGTALLLGASAVGIGLVVVFVVITPGLLHGQDARFQREAQGVVGILGVCAALMLPLGMFSGVLSGCERFDLKNVTRCSCQLIGLGVIVVLLKTGAGLSSVAWVTLAAEVGTGLLDYRLVRWLCPQLRISRRLVTRAQARTLVTFGAKTLLQGLARAGLYQTSGLVVAYYLGPLALAVYARQRALVTFGNRLLNQYGNVFTPVSGSLDAAGDRAGLEALLIKAARYGLYVSLPIVVLLAVLGDRLVWLWMGPRYEAPWVLGILSVGHLFSFMHRGVFRVLVGMNRHGVPALAELIGAATSVGLALLAVGVFRWGLEGASLAVAITVAVSGGLVPAVHACRCLEISVKSYFGRVVPGPVVAVLPFAACLVAARLCFAGEPLAALAAGLGPGGVVLAVIYWRYILPETLKLYVLQRIGMRWSRAAAG